MLLEMFLELLLVIELIALGICAKGERLIALWQLVAEQRGNAK